MKKLVFSLVIVLIGGASFAAEKVQTVWYQMPFFQGGDVGQYQTTMGQDRDQVRKQLWGELMDEVQKLAQSGASVEKMIGPMANILMMFDQIHDTHKAIDSVGINIAIENQFKASLDTLYTQYNISDSDRKLQVLTQTEAMGLDSYINQLSHSKDLGTKLNSREIDNKKALYLMKNLDYVSYGTFSSIGNGQFQLTYSLISYRTGLTKSFSARGTLIGATDLLAQNVFDYFQKNKYEDWKASNEELQWLPMPINIERAATDNYEMYTFNEAKTYCQSRGYRLPFAREILMAESGTQYKKGGINNLNLYAKWAVADRRETNDNNWIIPANGNSTSGIFMADSSISMKGVFWCVKGNSSYEVKKLDKIWAQIRKARNKNLEVYVALQTLRFEMGDYNAKSSDMIFWNNNFVNYEVLGSVDEAMEVLTRNGIVLE